MSGGGKSCVLCNLHLLSTRTILRGPLLHRIELYAERHLFSDTSWSEKKRYVEFNDDSGTRRATIALSISPCGRILASSHGDHNVRVTEWSSEKCMAVLSGHPRTPWCVQFHPTNSSYMISGCLGGLVLMWKLSSDFSSGEVVSSCKLHYSIASLCWNPVGSDFILVACCTSIFFLRVSQDMTLSSPFLLWDCGVALRFIKLHPHGRFLLTAEQMESDTRTRSKFFTTRVRLWNFCSQNQNIFLQEPVLDFHKCVAFGETSLSISRDGSLLVLCAADNDSSSNSTKKRKLRVDNTFAIRIISLSSGPSFGKELAKYQELHYRQLTAVQFTPLNQFILLGYAMCDVEWQLSERSRSRIVMRVLEMKPTSSVQIQSTEVKSHPIPQIESPLSPSPEISLGPPLSEGGQNNGSILDFHSFTDLITFDPRYSGDSHSSKGNESSVEEGDEHVLVSRMKISAGGRYRLNAVISHPIPGCGFVYGTFSVDDSECGEVRLLP